MVIFSLSFLQTPQLNLTANYSEIIKTDSENAYAQMSNCEMEQVTYANMEHTAAGGEEGSGGGSGGGGSSGGSYRSSGQTNSIYSAGCGGGGGGHSGPVCGNGFVENGEWCDGNNLGGRTCQNSGFTGGTLSCNSNCTLNTSQCTSGSTCGNGTVDPGEQCDTGGGAEASVPSQCNPDTQLCQSCQCVSTPVVADVGFFTSNQVLVQNIRDLVNQSGCAVVLNDSLIHFQASCSPNEVYTLNQSIAQVLAGHEAEILTYPNVKGAPAGVDSLLGSQYNLDKMSVVNSWGVGSAQNTSVSIGLFDTGFKNNPYHEDLLTPQVGRNLCISGTSFGCQLTNFNSVMSHGTYVGGLLAAKTHNDLGIGGILNNRSAGDGYPRLYVVQSVHDGSNPMFPLGQVTTNDIAGGMPLVRALCSTCKVMYVGFDFSENYSTPPDPNDTTITCNNPCEVLPYPSPEYAQCAYDKCVVNILRNNLNDRMLVLPAGNRNLEMTLPQYSNTVVVGGVDQLDQKWVNSQTVASNTGSWIDLSAPAKDILTLSDPENNLYPAVSGTSYSAAEAAGVLALMFRVNSGLSITNARDYLKASVDKYPPQGASDVPSDTGLGTGRINAECAVYKAANNGATCPSPVKPVVSIEANPNPMIATPDVPVSINLTCNVINPDARPLSVHSFRFKCQDTDVYSDWQLGDNGFSCEYSSPVVPATFNASCQAVDDRWDHLADGYNFSLPASTTVQLVECMNDTQCSDSNFCNGTETCNTQQGICVAGSVPCGDDGLFCNGTESCNESSDSCDHSGDPCSSNQTCNEGSDQCVNNNEPPQVNAGPDQVITLPSSVNLNGTVSDVDGPSLTTTWSKTSGTGTVDFADASLIDTTASFSIADTYVLRLTANDGVADPVFDEVTVTVNPQCTSASDCNDNNACTDDVCSAGVCVNPNNTISCDDGNLCTTGDQCANGTCGSGTPVTCSAPDLCHDAGTCNPANGQCENAPEKPDGTSCADTDLCNGEETCQAGICESGIPPCSMPLFAQCYYGECNPQTGVCESHQSPDGTSCNDNNLCTDGDSCLSGICNGNIVPGCITCEVDQDCNDGNSCTNDSCGEEGICVNSNNTNPCDDANACTTGDQCLNGSCDPGSVIPGCIPCQNDTQCNDSNLCNGTESCQSGQCVAGTPLSCGDNNICNGTETCDPIQGCLPGAPLNCSDNNICNGTETCSPTLGCQTGTPLSCDDGLFCNGTETCSPVNGCQAGTAPCTAGQTCDEPTDQCLAVNQAPTANGQSVSTPEDTAKAITLTGDDPEGSALTFTIVSQPTHGILSGTAPNIIYTPTLNYSGSDSFTFKVNDGSLDSINIATVSITVTAVNDAPVANAQSVSTNEDTAKAITLTGSDVEGTSLIYNITSSPAHGALTGTGANKTYTPAANYNGPDSFTFTVTETSGAPALASAPATVSITVTPVNDAPIAVNDSSTTSEDTPKDINVLANDSDVDGDVLNVTTVGVPTAPTKGTVSINPDKTVRYTPNLNLNGSDTFSYTISDGTVSATATVTMTITPVNDAPTANAQSVSTNEDTAKTITLSGSDVEGTSLNYTIVDTSNLHGTISSGSTANRTYTPAANYNGPASFTFTVTETSGSPALTSTPATVSITVNPVNDAPIATPQSVSTPEDTPKSITLGGTDADGDPLTYSIVAQPTHGNLSGAAPGVTYTPTLNYSGADSFTFRVYDGIVYSTTVTVSITVTSVNDAPTANEQSVTTNQNTAKSITLTANDVDSGSLTYQIVAQPTHGNLSGTAPNITYTPTSGYIGPDSFTFRAYDGSSYSNVATISITVLSVGSLTVSSGNLSSSGTQGGPFSPISTTYTLQNTGGTSLNWTASDNQSWIDISPASGTLAVGANAIVTVSINTTANSLTTSATPYSGSVSFYNTTNGIGNTSRSVSLLVGTPMCQNTVPLTKLVATDRSVADFFGMDMAIEGDVMVVGAYQPNEPIFGGTPPDSGAAYIFVRNPVNNTWNFRQKLTGEFSGDYFGVNIAILNGTILIGAPHHDYDNGGNFVENAGAVYVYVQDNAPGNPLHWGLLQKITAPDRTPYAYFASGSLDAVSMSNNTIVVGAYRAEANFSGAAYIFERPDGAPTFGFKKKLTLNMVSAGEYEAGAEFGYSVSILGNDILVGARDKTVGIAGGAGAVYAFKYQGNDWNYVQKLTLSNPATNDLFGSTLSMSENRAVIGQYFSGNVNNGVSIFANEGGSWVFKQKLTNPNPGAGYGSDTFGSGAAISGNILVVGHPGYQYDNCGGGAATMDTGIVYVYYDATGTNNWVLNQKLIATGPNGRVQGIQFGRNVAISEEGRIVSGAIGQSTDQNGNNPVSRAGAVWVSQPFNIPGTIYVTPNVDIFSYGEAGGPFSQPNAVYTITNMSGNTIQYSVTNTQNWLTASPATGSLATGASQNIIVSLNANANSLASAQTAYTDTITFTNTSTGNGNTSRTFSLYVGEEGSCQNTVPLTKLVATDRSVADFFGMDMAIEGDVMVVGAYQPNEPIFGGTPPDSGAAYIFVRNPVNNTWNFRQKLTGEFSGDYFGVNIAILNGTILIGAPHHDYDNGGNFVENAGAVYVYVQDNAPGNPLHWGLLQKITAPDRTPYAYFASGSLDAVSMSNNTIVVGAYRAEANFSGAAYIFERPDGAPTFGFKKKLTLNMVSAGEYEAGAEFGYSVSILGNDILVGARDKTVGIAGGAGAVYAFKYQGNDWNYVQKLTLSNPATNDLFGSTLSMSENRAVIGQYFSGNVNNGVSIFANEGGSWVFKQKLTNPNPGAGYGSDTFGSGAAISGNILVVGHPGYQYDNCGGGAATMDTGIVYVYYDATGTNNWVLNQKLIATGPNGRVQGIQFGRNVAISEEGRIVSGAIGQSTDQNGNNPVSRAGAVWVSDIG